MSVEIWKPVKDFEGLYEVSNHGRVKSLKRFHAKERILKQYIDRYGYMKVVLTKESKPHYFTVHRLVALMFVDNPLHKTTVDHIDCNRRNNCAENLRWATPKENNLHSHKLGRQIWNSKPIVAVSPKGEMFFFNSQREAAKFIGMNQCVISRMLHGRNHSAKGWCFKYGSHESVI